MSILDDIFKQRRLEVTAARRKYPEVVLEASLEGMPTASSLASALKRPKPDPTPRLIAEVKYRSPSKGILCPKFDPQDLARTYAQNGAAAISVLTEGLYFGGSLEHLHTIAQIHLGLPLLCKDFIFDRYQLLEARLAGASAVLLIVAMLSPGQLRLLLALAHALGLEALVETHTASEIAQALEAGAGIVGVNNRDLHTFEVRLETCLRLRPLIPQGVVMVAESGIRSAADVARLAAAGVDAMLVGEGLVTAADVGSKVRELVRAA